MPQIFFYVCVCVQCICTCTILLIIFCCSQREARDLWSQNQESRSSFTVCIQSELIRLTIFLQKCMQMIKFGSGPLHSEQYLLVCSAQGFSMYSWILIAYRVMKSSLRPGWFPSHRSLQDVQIWFQPNQGAAASLFMPTCSGSQDGFGMTAD